MKKYVGILFFAAGLIMPISLLAQTSQQELSMAVGSTSLIKVVNEATAGSTTAEAPAITLTLAGAGEAGQAVNATTSDESSRLRMTSYTVGTNKRSISAELTGTGSTLADWEFSNTELKVGLVIPREANRPNFQNYATQAGTGLKGVQSIASPTAVGGKVLADQIGTAWSGMGAGDGYVIRYEFIHVNTTTPADPVSQATVTFTITGD